MSSSAPLCAFNEARDRFAVVTLDGRLKLWEVKGASLVHTYSAADHLSQRYTCLAWSSANDGGGAPGNAKKQKKRKREKGAERAAGLGLIALGAANGCITVWDLARGEVRATLGGAVSGGGHGKGGHKGGVSDIAWSADGSTLYSCSADDKRVLEWSVPAEAGADEASEARKVCSWANGASRLALRPASGADAGALLAVASIKVGLFDPATGDRQRTFGAGHSSDAHALAFSSEQAGRFLVSACAGSNFINLYDCTGSLPDAKPKDSTPPMLVFSCEGNVSAGSLSLSCLPPLDGGTAGGSSLSLCARTVGGTLAIWSASVSGSTGSAKAGKPIAADGFAVVQDGSGTRKTARQVLCGQVAFSAAAGGDFGSLSVDVVRGTESQPVFDCWTASSGTSSAAEVELAPLVRSTLLPAGGTVAADSIDAAAPSQGGSKKADSKRAKLVAEATKELAARDAAGGLLVGAPTLAEREVRMGAVDEEGGAASSEDAAEAAASALTLGARAAALAERFDVTAAQAADRAAEGKVASTAAAAGSNYGAVTALPRAGSLTSVLEQALQANDDALLEFVLRSVEPKVRRMRAAKRALAVTPPDDNTLMHHA